MPGIEAERYAAEDTKIGLLAYVQESTKNSWATHQDKHDLEDKALALAVNGVKDALELAVGSVRDDQRALRELLETRINALADEQRALRELLQTRIDALLAIVEQKDHDADERAMARRESFEKDLVMWRSDHMRMHEITNDGNHEKHDALAKQTLTYDSESRARWDNHFKTHDSQELRSQESVGALTRLQDEKQRAHDQIHQASQRAIDIADTSMADRLGEMNNLRQQITAERGTYVNRDMLDSRLAEASANTTAASKTNEARLGSLERSQNVAYGVMMVLVFAIPIGLRFLP